MHPPEMRGERSISFERLDNALFFLYNEGMTPPQVSSFYNLQKYGKACYVYLTECVLMVRCGCVAKLVINYKLYQ